MKKILIVMLMAVALAGCEKTRTVEYYKENESARQAKIKECANNPGELEHTPNCENAMTAQVQLEFSSDNITMPSIE